MRSLFLTTLLLSASLPASVHAQALASAQDTAPATSTDPDEDEDEDFEDEIVVIAGRLRGSVDAPQPPILTLDEEEISAYGASSIEELLEALSAQTGSGRGRGGGRPVLLLNGQRVSSFREMRSIPPEAIRRVEILPEEVALRFGYPPDERVVNIILKDNFSSKQVAGEFNVPTRGGYTNWEAEGGLFRIDGPSRTNLEAKYTGTSMLTEAERGIEQDESRVPTVAGDPDPAEFRSLAGEDKEFVLNGTWTMGIGEGGLGGSLTGNAAYTRSETLSLSGLDTATLTDPATGDSELRTFADPLRRRAKSDTFEAGLAFNKPLGDWQLTVTGDGSYVESTTLVDRQADTADIADAVAAGTLAYNGALPSLADAGFDTARSKDLAVSSLATIVGSPLLLPGGEAQLTLRAGLDYDRSDNEDTRTTLGATVLERRDASAGFNLGIPITSRREDFGAAIGDLSANFSGGINDLSDFGLLTDWNAGLTWRPTTRLTLQASYIFKEAAPSLSQLGAPQIVTLNVPVYDFTTGQNVLVTSISGGNPDLRAEAQRDIKLSANWEFPVGFAERSNLLVEFFRNRSSDVTQSFPLLTAAIEDAFPDRVVRDASGQLVSIDRRAVTYDEVRSSNLRWGFNFFGKLGSDDAPSGGASGRSGGGEGRSAAAAPQAAMAAPASGGMGGAPRLDPAQWTQFRLTLCGPEGGPVPDAESLPEQVKQRLRREDGTIDEERLARLRERVCAADAQPPRAFDPARMEQMRQLLCGEGAIDPAALPEQMRERLVKPDGTIDEARVAMVRQRFCGAGGPGQAGQQASSGEGGGQNAQPPAGGMPFGRSGPRGGRWNVSIYHTVRFSDEVRIAPGGPVLDQLSGDAIAAGGVPRHQIEFDAGLFKDGYGLRLDGTWTGPAMVNGSGLPGSSDLRFGSIFRADARVFVDLGQRENLVAKYPFLKGARLSFVVDNIFDSRQKVTDANGDTPLAYQRAYREPQGRVIGIDFRKMF